MKISGNSWKMNETLVKFIRKLWRSIEIYESQGDSTQVQDNWQPSASASSSCTKSNPVRTDTKAQGRAKDSSSQFLADFDAAREQFSDACKDFCIKDWKVENYVMTFQVEGHGQFRASFGKAYPDSEALVMSMDICQMDLRSFDFRNLDIRNMDLRNMARSPGALF